MTEVIGGNAVIKMIKSATARLCLQLEDCVF